ncbi:hypothetical protein, partial [Bosea sp. (in: a-proteobacteria)]|uniref:hypothetical protein n=1 Tax=Bosea sp. (in: a-proteobacteria) TaxID=1871050 RepID=UPI0025BE3DAE
GRRGEEARVPVHDKLLKLVASSSIEIACPGALIQRKSWLAETARHRERRETLEEHRLRR